MQAYNQQCSAVRQAGRQPAAAPAPGHLLAWNAGLLAGVRYSTCRLQATTQLTASGLDGQNIANTLHAVGGAYADLLLGGRSLAFHAEVALSQVGSRGSFEARNNLSAGSYEWRGLEAQLRVGLRLFTRLSAQ